MKPFLVLLLVAAAAGGLFFVLQGGDGGTGTGNLGADSTTVERSDDTSTDDQPTKPTNLVATDGGRKAADIEAIPTEVESVDEPLLAEIGAGELTGTVTGPKGTPIEGATVVLTRFGADMLFFGEVDRTEDAEATTGTSGTFTFKNVPPYESYSLIATHPDYSRSEIAGVVVQDGIASEAPPIVMNEGQKVFGKVIDSGGNPVPNAALTLSQRAFVAELGGTDDSAQATSDAQGNFEFKNVTAQQNYALKVVADGYGTITKNPIQVIEGENLELTMTVEVASLIAGRVVVSADGTPIEGAVVQAWSLDNVKSRSHTETRSTETGDFEVADIAPGRYQIVVRHPSYEPSTQTRVEAGEMNVAIELRPLPVITGQVVDAATGAPITKFEAQLRQGVPGSQDGLSTAIVASRAKFEDPEGRFQMVVPRSGEFMVEAIARGYADTYSLSFQTAMGQDSTGIVVRMTRGGTLMGRVLGDGGQPIKGAIVETRDKEWSDDPFWASLGAGAPGNATETKSVTGEDGSYKLEALTPGQYQLIVRHRDYAQKTVKELVITEGQEYKVNDVLLPRGAEVTGTVRGPSGRPMPGATVKLYPNGADLRSYTAQTNKAGEYSVKNVGGGSYLIHATRPRTSTDNVFIGNIDLKNTQRPITVASGQKLVGEDFKISDN